MKNKVLALMTVMFGFSVAQSASAMYLIRGATMVATQEPLIVSFSYATASKNVTLHLSICKDIPYELRDQTFKSIGKNINSTFTLYLRDVNGERCISGADVELN